VLSQLHQKRQQPLIRSAGLRLGRLAMLLNERDRVTLLCGGECAGYSGGILETRTPHGLIVRVAILMSL
jgi:hypothetical protein